MSPLKVLIVEDDPATLDLMTESLAALRLEVCPVADSRMAAELINREKFDGIFLDLEMPYMNGFDVANQVRGSSWNRSTPIVVVSGRDDRRTMQQVFATGATFFLQKPVDRQKLTRLVRSVRGAFLDNRRRHRRVPLRAKVLVRAGSRTLQGLIWNVSEGGVQLEVSDLQLGAAIEFSFCLPANSLVEAAGEVIWTKENRQGIRFTRVAPEGRMAIEELVASAES